LTLTEWFLLMLSRRPTEARRANAPAAGASSAPACEACGADDFEFLTRISSIRVPNYRKPVVICRRCGFVTVRPRPSSAEYAAINDRWFGLAYSDDPEVGQTPAQGAGRAQRLWERVGPHVTQPIGHVLDVGAGKGWSIEFLKSKFPDLRAAVIDPVAELQADLWKRLDVEVVTTKLEEQWPTSLAERFDLVVFRHTLEHLEHPLEALRRIATCLAPGGYAYIVVPNALNIRPGHRMRTDFFRPVHLHYFNRHTLTRIARRAGLEPAVIGDEGEIWGMFRRAGSAAPQPAINSYLEQRSYLMTRLAQARWIDRKVMAKTFVRSLVPEPVLALTRRARRRPRP
jgi:SAM-dependent methyltransferase